MKLQYVSAVVLCSLFCLQTVSAQEGDAVKEKSIDPSLEHPTRIAVLDFHGSNLDDAMLSTLAEEARVSLLANLSTDDYQIMTKENTLTILEDMGLDASALEGRDEVEVGRNIHADLIMTGSVVKLDDTYVVTVKLFDTHTAQMLYAHHIEAKSVHKLYKKLSKMTKKGLKKHL